MNATEALITGKGHIFSEHKDVELPEGFDENLDVFTLHTGVKYATPDQMYEALVTLPRHKLQELQSVLDDLRDAPDHGA